MIELKDIQGRVIYSTEINNGAKRKFQLMKEDYITLPFSLEKPIKFGGGCNTEVNGELFEVTELQKPTYNNTTGGYDYQLRLDAYYWKWKNKIFKFTPEVGGQEASWSLTASLDVHLGIFLRNLKALGYTYRGSEFEFSIDATVENKAISMSYENTNMIDALSAMAENWQCEWWLTDNTIHFGRCEYGNPIDFELGVNVDEMKASASQSPYATRLYVFGSTRNLPANYRPTDESLLVNGVVQKRLMLPEGTPYLDAYAGMKEEEAIEEVVVLEDVYPKTDGKIASVVTYEDSVENEDGTTSKETFYRFTDEGINFSKDYILEGQELKVKFTSGLLNGMEFGLAFNPNDEPEKNEDGTWNPSAQLYEVVVNEDYGRKLPDDTLNPKVGDSYILLGWDSTKIADLGLVSKAETELLSEGQKILEKRKVDPSTYSCRMFSDYMYANHLFEVGDRVNLINETYFENGRQSRIIGFEYNLDFPFDNPVFIVGETASYSRLGELENKLDALTYKGQTYTSSGGGSSVYIIGTTDTTKPSNKNVFSAARTERDFITKTKDDKTPFSLGVGKNLSVGEDLEVKGSASIQEGLSIGGNIESKDFAEGTEKGGYAIRKNSDEQYEVESDNIIARILAKTYDLLVQNHATFVGDLSSEEFISGFMGGKGWSIRTKEILNAAGINEKKSVAEFDDLIVRGSMRIYEFIVSQLLGENDNRIFTGMMEVDHYDANDGKVYLKTDNGRLYNPFRVDDVIIVQQYGGNHSQESGYYVTKQYEFIVTEVGVGEQGEDRLDWVRFRNFTTSMEGGNEELITEYDTLVRIDNISDANRKGIIQLMSVGEDTPYMDFIYGAKTDPENSLKGRLGNLGGVYNPLFGWLKEFGAYLTNLYAVGEFVIAHTGENVSDSIEIAKGQFRTNYRQTTFDMSEEQNFFTNASMTNNCEHWVLGSDATEYFMVDELPQFFNFDLYASEQTYAGLSEWKGRDMLRLSKSSIMQANSLIDKAGTHKVYTGSVENDDGSYTDTYEEVADTLYLSVRFFVSVSGKLEFVFVENGKFIDNSFHYSSNVTAREDGYEVKLSGIWDGKGDFTITSTGDIYVDLLSLTDKPLDNFKITTETKIKQDATRISLLGKKINGVEGSVTDLGIELNAAEERITAYVNKEIKGVESSISSLEVSVKGIRTTVASVQGTATDAKNLANTAQSAANDAASKALAAQTTANSANSKADANATAIAQTESSISLLAGAFTLKDGKYVLTSAAGAVITSEVASIYATKSNVNSLGERVSTAESRITTTANSISALTSKITFDSNGNITNINKSGLMVESNFASMFSTQVTAQGIAKTASLTSYVAKTELGDLVSKIKISADQIDLQGVVTSTAFNNALSGYATDSELSAAQKALNTSISNLNTTLSTKIDAKASTESLNTKVSELNTAISKKADTSRLGSVAYMNDIANAACNGSTLIVGGYINADLLKVEKIYADEGTVGGFSIGEKSLTNTAGDVQLSIGNLQGTKFAVMNSPNNSMLQVRNDDATAIYVYTHGTSGVGIYITAQIGAKAINSYGNVSLTARSGELISITGLAVSATATSGTSTSNMDFIRMTGDLTLPEPNSMKGKVYFIKCNDSYTLSVPKCVRCTSAYSSRPGTATWSNDDTRAFISDGVVWHEFYTGT